MKFRPAFARMVVMVAVVAVLTMLGMFGLIWFLKSRGVDPSSMQAVLSLALGGGVIGGLISMAYARITHMADMAAREEPIPDDGFGC